MSQESNFRQPNFVDEEDEDASSPPPPSNNNNNNSEGEPSALTSKRSETPPPSQSRNNNNNNKHLRQEEQNDDGNDDDDFEDRLYAETLRKSLEIQAQKEKEQQQQQKQKKTTPLTSATSSPTKKSVEFSVNHNNNNNNNNKTDEGEESEENSPEPENLHIQLEPNQKICGGKYNTIARLGAGESSTVWLVEEVNNTSSNNNQQPKHFAIKLFKKDPFIKDSYDYERKVNEFMMKQLSLPQIQEQIATIISSSSPSSSSLSSSFRNLNERSNLTNSTKKPNDIHFDPSMLALSTKLSKLPFAAQDAVLRVQLMHRPKAAIRPCQEPTFFCMKPEHHRTYGILKKPDPRSTSKQQEIVVATTNQLNSPLTAKNNRKTTTSSASPPSSRTKNKSSSMPREEEPPSPVLLTYNKNSTISPPNSPRFISANNNNTTNTQQQQQQQQQQKDKIKLSIAPLIGHSVHRQQHLALIFNSFGPCVEWMMSIFSYKGVPLPVAVQIISSACEALVQLEVIHMVHTDLKPENLLFVEREYPKLEAVAKKSLAAHGAPLSLFRVVLIDFGLSFLLPLSRREVKERKVGVASSQRASSSSGNTTSRSSHNNNNNNNNNSSNNGNKKDSSRGRPSSSSSFALSSVSTSSSRRQPQPQQQQQNKFRQEMNDNTSATRNLTMSPTKNSTCLSAEELLLLQLSNYKRGNRLQTREYRAPEIIFGSHFSHPADIWSLGCTAWELVTGNFLFDPKRFLDSEEVLAMNDLTSATTGEGEMLIERSMDLIHLFEMRRVSGDPVSSSFLTKYGEGGSEVHAHRYISTHTNANANNNSINNKNGTSSNNNSKLKLLCECEKEFERREKHIVKAVTIEQNNKNENDDDDDGDDENRSPSPSAEIEGMLLLHQEYQNILEVEQERKQILLQQSNNNAAIFHFCCDCQRIAFVPEEFSVSNNQSVTRDLRDEAMQKFGVGDDYGLDQFVSFVRSCVAWEPSKRLSAAELLGHSFFSIWAKKQFSD